MSLYHSPLPTNLHHDAKLTLVQLVLLHDAVLYFLLLLRGPLAALPVRFLVRVGAAHVVGAQAGLNELGGGVRRGLARRPHQAPVLQVGAVERFHLVDLVGEVNVSVEGRVRCQEVAGFAVHLTVVGDAVGWMNGEGKRSV